MNSRSIARPAAVLAALCLSAASFGQVNVTTWQNSLQHTGANLQETVLTPGTVSSPGNFGLLFTQPLDGLTFGQPLFMSAATLGQFADGSTHNVVYVGTENDSLYAFDADAVNGGQPLWKDSLLPAGTTAVPQGDVGSGDIQVELGITATPVIDPASNTIYVVSKVKTTANSTYQQYLHALDLKTGAERFGGPVLINPTFSGKASDAVNGVVPFSALHEHLRSAMILYNGIVYMAYASHSDTTPYHGEILGYSASTLKPVSTFITTPNGQEAGFWASGAGPAIDNSGNMFIPSANGAFDQNVTAGAAGNDWGETILKLPTNTTGAITLAYTNNSQNFFTPNNWNQLNQGDLDLGSGGLLLLPDQTGGNHPHIMVGGGKAGVLYVVDRDNLGGINTPDNAIQEIPEINGSGIFVTPAYYNGYIYYASAGNGVEQRQVGYDGTTGGYISSTAITSSNTYSGKGSSVFITADNDANGLVWVLRLNGLDVYNANDVAGSPIYAQNSTVPTGNISCQTTKFSIPMVANGKAYYTAYDSSNQGHLFVSGILPSPVGTPAAPGNPKATANSASAITLTWTSESSNESGFSISRSVSPTTGFTTVGTVGAAVTSYADTNLASGTQYYYQVFATNANGSSNGSTVATATTFPPYLPAGIVGLWHLDDGAVATVSDSSGNGNTGTVTGETVYQSACIINGCYLFHGTGNAFSNIAVPNNSSFQFSPTQSFTLSAWVNPQNINGKEQAVVAKSADQGNAYGIYINAANNWVFRGPEGDIVGPAATQGSWTNVTAVQNGPAATRTLYVNGSAVATGIAQAADGDGALWMAQQNNSSELDSFPGYIDEVQLYNIALTPGQVTDQMSPPILDAVSNRQHGTLGAFAISLAPASNPGVEPRQQSPAGSLSLVLSFSAPVSGITAKLGLQNGGAATGSISSLAYDSTGKVVTIALTGVANAQALNLHLSGIMPGNGTADLPFGFLLGDVNGDNVVDSHDLEIVQNSYTPLITQATAAYDINADGQVNAADAALVNAALGTKTGTQVDSDLALFQPATASSVTGTNTASLAVDNNSNTRWESQYSDPQWIQIDLGSTSTIHKIVLDWENAAGSNYSFAVSPDGASNWTPLGSPVTGNNGGGIRTYTGLNGTGRYVRITGTTRTTQYGYSLYAFQIFGVPGSTVTGGTAPTITSALTASSSVGTAFTYSITASQSPSSYSASNLPAWLSVNQTTGVITGTPTAAGSYSLTIGAINKSGTGTATLVVTVKAAVPAAPAALSATGNIGNVALTWTASSGATTYNVYRGTVSGGEGTTAFTTGITSTAFTDSTVAAGTQYFYKVAAVNTGGTSALSNESSATPKAATSGTTVYQVAAGSATANSAISPYLADEFYSSGATAGPYTNKITIAAGDTAPAGVYESERYGGSFTYTLPNLTPGSAYTVNLHFAEIYFTAVGQRTFNVAINGTTVLSKFDIVQAAGGPNIAIVKSFSATASSAGQIVISFTSATADQPKVSAVELLSSEGTGTAPSAPTAVTATPGAAQVALSWTASAGAATYNVYRGTVSGGEGATALATGLTSATYTDTSVTNGTTYFYKLAAVNSAGASVLSSEASATPKASTASAVVYQIAAGTRTASAATNPYVPDEFFSAGATSGPKTNKITLAAGDTAPSAVYESERNGGSFAYTLPSLTPGSTYTVNLHFAETYFTAAGQRTFNVAINSVSVLSNFDILQAAGGANIAVIKSFTATANSSGQIVVSFTSGTMNQPKVNGIEVLSNGTPISAPAAPTALTAGPLAGQVSLTWNSSTSALSYNIYRGTAAGAENATAIATGITGTSFADSSVTNGTTYYYKVAAVNNGGLSPLSNEASATPVSSSVTGTAIYRIGSGDTAAASSFTADQFYTGGGTSSSTNAISTTAVASPAPAAVYQHARLGNFSYVFPKLTPGAKYLVRLHFAEYYWTAAHQRVFDVSINGATQLVNFDIFAAAGGPNTAIVEQFMTTADASGNITVAYYGATADQPKSSGIEIYAQ